MPSILTEALEWLDRAEQAREVAGQLTDPDARKAVWSLPKGLIGSPEPPRHPPRSGGGNWPQKIEKEPDDFSNALLSPKHQVRVGRWKRMRHHEGFLTPEERAKITELQDLFIECYVERKKAVADGQEERVKSVEAEIDSLLREEGRDREMGGIRIVLVASC
jgi:hypothetical protein